MPEFNRPALLAASPVGALDPSYTPQQSSLVDNSDPFARAIDKREQSIIEAQERLQSIKDNKWARVGRALAAGGAGLAGRNPQAVLQPHQQRVDALHNQIAQGQAGIEDLNMQRYLLEQKARMGANVADPSAVREYEYWRNLNPDARADFERLKRDPTALDQWKIDNAEILRELAAQQKGAETDATNWSKERGDIIKQGMTARTMLPKIQRMLELNEMISTGKTAGLRKAMGDFFNVTDPNVGEFNSLAGNMVLGQIRQLGANPTEGERAYLADINASLSQGRGVNSAILKGLGEVQQRMIERAKWFAEDRTRTMDEWLMLNGDFEFNPNPNQQDIVRDPAEQAADANQGAVDTSGFKILSVED